MQARQTQFQSPTLTAILKDLALFSPGEFSCYEQLVKPTNPEVQQAVRILGKQNQLRLRTQVLSGGYQPYTQLPWMKNIVSDRVSPSSPSSEHIMLLSFVRERAYLRAQCSEFESQLHTQSQCFGEERAKLEKELASLHLESQRFTEERAKLEQEISTLKKALEVESQRLLALL